MPRIRSIKPEFWTSAQVLECSTNARLLFIGLWNFCDDAGRHPFSSKQVKAEIFPADPFTLEQVGAMLKELIDHKLIVPYEFEDTQYFYISGWKHQKIDRPQKPRYPDPLDEHSSSIRRTFVPDTIRYDTIVGESEESTNESRGKPNGHPEEEYAFVSGVIKLNQKNYDQWLKAYSHLDLCAELLALTKWANGLGPGEWFHAIPNALAKKNREQKTKIETSKKNPITWKSGKEGIL